MKKFAPVCLVFASALTLAGCSGGGGGSEKMKNDLKQIGMAYHSHNDAAQKGPANAEELGKHLENDARLIGLLKSGEIVFAWNVALTDLMKADGASNTVIAYEKSVPEKGGWVLFGDASVRNMKADEFKTAKKAKGL